MTITKNQRPANWLTYRFESSTGGDARRRALVDYISIIQSEPFWDEPTSFLLFRSVLPPGQITQGIMSVIDIDRDVVLISTVGSEVAHSLGKDPSSELKELWPNVVILPRDRLRARIAGALRPARTRPDAQ